MSWAVSTQCPADQAEEAMNAAWDTLNSPADSDREQFDIAVVAVTTFLDGQQGWFNINTSGHSVPDSDDVNRPHVAISCSPALTPYGVGDTTPSKPGKPKG
jgi:hypothetical protein